MDETRRAVLDVSKGGTDAVSIVAEISFCESSASLRIGKLTVNLPWSELAMWQMWLATSMESKA